MTRFDAISRIALETATGGANATQCGSSPNAKSAGAPLPPPELIPDELLPSNALRDVLGLAPRAR